MAEVFEMLGAGSVPASSSSAPAVVPRLMKRSPPPTVAESWMAGHSLYRPAQEISNVAKRPRLACDQEVNPVKTDANIGVCGGELRGVQMPCATNLLNATTLPGGTFAPGPQPQALAVSCTNSVRNLGHSGSRAVGPTATKRKELKCPLCQRFWPFSSPQKACQCLLNTKCDTPEAVAVQRLIAESRTADELLDICVAHHLDEANCSAGLCVLARLPEAARPHPSDARLVELLNTCKLKAATTARKHLHLSMQAAVKLGVRDTPGYTPIRCFADSAVSLGLNQFNAEGLSALAFCMAEAMDRQEAMYYMLLVARASIHWIQDFQPRHIVKLVVAMADVLCRDGNLLSVAAQAVAPKAASMTPKNLSRLISAYARLQFWDQALLNACTLAAHKNLMQFEPADLLETLEAYQKLSLLAPQQPSLIPGPSPSFAYLVYLGNAVTPVLRARETEFTKEQLSSIKAIIAVE